MFRRLCGSGSGALTTVEMAAVEQLCESRGQLLLECGVPDVRSDAGCAACAVFLAHADKAARALALEVAPRGYRANFSANYRALFPDNNRHYRVDVLEASVSQQAAIWVNGEEYQMSGDVMAHGEALQRACADLSAFLVRWQEAWLPSAPENLVKPGRADLATALMAFDISWAEFERRYIGELIAIEDQARQVIVRAVQHENHLRIAELRGSGPEKAEAERSLMQCIAHLNSVANFRRKGRDDLGCDVLDSARAVVERCQSGGDMGRGSDAANTLAADVLGSYEAMRSYFRKVGPCIEHVDPHLCNNAGLVARLVDWEETWEVGARYVRSTPLLEAVCDTVAEVREAQQVAPELTSMIEDCDVELFMVLPRMVVLCFLAGPQSKRAELVRSLLPHRFGPPAGDGPGAPAPQADAELAALCRHFEETMRSLASLQRPGAAAPCAPERLAWEALVKQAILGTEDEDHDTDSGLQPEAQAGVRDLLRSLERWSLELQRHCPEDWNQCSAVLVHCLTGGAEKKAPTKFQV